MSENKLPTFVLKAPADFWWPVVVPIPHDGGYLEAKLDVLFKALPQKRLDQMRGQRLDEGMRPPTDEEVVREVVLGWRELPDEAGNQVPFSPAALEQLVEIPVMRSALVATYLAATSGMAARKNA